MMKKIILSVCISTVTLSLFSQSYQFDSIPGILKKRADAVVRSSQCLYTVIDANRAKIREKTAITLMNENSSGYRYVQILYDDDSKVNYLRGTVYDEKGSIIKVLGSDYILDLSAVPGGTFYSDDRMKYLHFPVYNYPFTIEYEYEIEYSGIYSYEDWTFQDRPGQSVEKSGIQYVIPTDIECKFYEQNLKQKVDSVITPENRIYTWQEENIPAVLDFAFLPSQHYPWPSVRAAPEKFFYGGLNGSLSSWKSFGEWNYKLISGLDNLPQSELVNIAEITSMTPDIRERAKRIYEYMQSKTRYVSIQIGIGGLRPAEASAVVKNGFGDCKALVNYTKALLKAGGITSYYTLVKSGPDGEIKKEFVDDQFDHIILCVPLLKDTVWLECTNQTIPFNYLGNFTDNRYVLLITPEGGKLVKTPGFSKSDNVITRKGSIYLNNFGQSSARLSESFSGINYDIANSLFGFFSEDELKRYIISEMRFSDLVPSVAKYTEVRLEKPLAFFTYDMTINDFATVSNKLLSFSPSIDKENYLPYLPAPINITEFNTSNDSITYHLPVDYKVEFKPADVILESEFGKFRYQIDVKADRILFKRYLALNKGKISLEKLEDFRLFINSVATADRGIIVLKR